MRALWTSTTQRIESLEVNINYLREKIDRSFDQRLNHAVRGAGYVLRELD